MTLEEYYLFKEIDKKGGVYELGIIWSDNSVDSYLFTCDDCYKVHS